MMSRVVPASSETIATSRRASALSRLDLPEFGAPASTTWKPSRTSSPRWPSSRCRAIASRSAALSPATSPRHRARHRPRRRNRSPPPAAPSPRSARSAIRRTIFASAPSACRNACRRCAAVSASIRSARPSTPVKSSLPFSKARRANSPGSASLQPSILPTAAKHTGHHRPAAVHLQLGHVLAGLALGRRGTTAPAPVQHLAAAADARRCGTRPSAASASAPPSARCTTPAAGPDTRITATPARPCPLDSAKMVSPLPCCFTGVRSITESLPSFSPGARLSRMSGQPRWQPSIRDIVLRSASHGSTSATHRPKQAHQEPRRHRQQEHGKRDLQLPLRQAVRQPRAERRHQAGDRRHQQPRR